jgi:hypothetical protein
MPPKSKPVIASPQPSASGSITCGAICKWGFLIVGVLIAVAISVVKVDSKVTCTNGASYILNGSGKCVWDFTVSIMEKPIIEWQTSYQGEWRDSKRHGKGIFISASGASYDGDWDSNERHGQGTFSIGHTSYKGIWTHNELDTQDGTIVLRRYSSSGRDFMPGAPEILHTATYYGPLRNGSMHGEGTIKFDATREIVVSMLFRNGTANLPAGSKSGKMSLGDIQVTIEEYTYDNGIPVSKVGLPTSQSPLLWRGDTLKFENNKSSPVKPDADLSRISDVLQSIHLISEHLNNVHHVINIEFLDFEPPEPQKPMLDEEFKQAVGGDINDEEEFIAPPSRKPAPPKEK